MKVEILGQTDGIIKAFFPNGNVELGNYETVERALEVLDEIQRILVNEWDFKDKFSMCRVYKMPKD